VSSNFLSSLFLSSSFLMAMGAALSFTTGGVFMQLSQGMTKLWPTLLVYGFFMLGATLQILVTRDAGMGLSYVLILGLEVLLASFFAVVFFKEGYSMAKLLGIFLVTVGVAVLRSEGG
jgi:multidrug transporter EmrE-like cation transporter